MGRLGGFRYREVIQRLRRFGFQFHRQAAGSHEIWHCQSTDRYTTIPIIRVTCRKERYVPS
jgi:predicted RNA binding protein YcfA (HicA-like mRNA interferase family)